MADMVGADAEALKELARQVGATADRLSGISGSLDANLANAPWVGRDAEQFRDRWSQQYRRDMVAAADALREARDALNRNADEQTQASSASDSGVGRLLQAALASVAAATAASTWARETGISQLEAMRHKSSEEQKRWWNSLTDEQRNALLSIAPGSLLALVGLPPEARATAANAYAKSLDKTIKSTENSKKFEGSGSVKFVKLAAGVELTTTTYRDGHVTVTLTGMSGLGVSVKVAGSQVSSSGSVTYTFASAEEAQKFTDGLAKTLIPQFDSKDDLARAALLGPTAGGLATYVASQVGEYLAANIEHLESLSGSVEGSGHVGLGANMIELGGGAESTYNVRTGETSVTVGVSGSATLAFGGAVMACGELESGLTVDDSGRVTSLVFRGEGTLANGVGASDGLHGYVSVDGNTSAFEMRIPMDDPEVQRLAAEIVTDIGRGNLEGASAKMADLYEVSTVILQTGLSQESSVGVTTGVASASLAESSTDWRDTRIKVPHGQFMEMPK